MDLQDMDLQKLTAKDIVARSPEHIFNEIDGEVVLLGIETGDFFGFDAILSKIWKMMETPIAISAIVEQLLVDFDVEPAVCEQDLLKVFNQMLGDKLIIVQ